MTIDLVMTTLMSFSKCSQPQLLGKFVASMPVQQSNVGSFQPLASLPRNLTGVHRAKKPLVIKFQVKVVNQSWKSPHQSISLRFMKKWAATRFHLLRRRGLRSQSLRKKQISTKIQSSKIIIIWLRLNKLEQLATSATQMPTVTRTAAMEKTWSWAE